MCLNKFRQVASRSVRGEVSCHGRPYGPTDIVDPPCRANAADGRVYESAGYSCLCLRAANGLACRDWVVFIVKRSMRNVLPYLSARLCLFDVIVATIIVGVKRFGPRLR